MVAPDFLPENRHKSYPPAFALVAVVASVLLFLFSIALISSSMKSFGYSLPAQLSEATANPFIGLFIGLLTTAVLQSSSSTTTIAVAAVATETIGIRESIPIILGANIGTTITSTLVSMSYITQAGEFRRAIAAGSIHDFFNILTVLIFFPLEIKYHILESVSSSMIGSLKPEDLGMPTIDFTSFFKMINEWLIDQTNGTVMLLVAAVLLFVCIKYISVLLYDILIGKTKEKFETTVFSNATKSFGWGFFLTSVVQSSSLTTSLLVPLVATNKVRLKRAFEFILGANIGTTITALLAAGLQSEPAIQLAVVHLLFNLGGVIIFLLIPKLDNLPIFLAEKLGIVTLKMRIIGFTYILFAFFLIPFTLIYLTKSDPKVANTVELAAED